MQSLSNINPFAKKPKDFPRSYPWFHTYVIAYTAHILKHDTKYMSPSRHTTASGSQYQACTAQLASSAATVWELALIYRAKMAVRP